MSSASERTSPPLPARWVVVTTLAVLGLLVWGTVRATTPPTALPVDAPDASFSAHRAREVMRRIYPDDRPHPVGSPANREVRDRIVGELRRLGLQPELQNTVTCRGPACGWVSNIVAEIDGERPAPAVLMSAHYDSVPAGPGIGDDGSGVGIVLEAARALTSGTKPRHTVILLIDDGEEAGLFGAHAFAQQHPRAKDVKVVVNVEARGTDGISRMFETKGPTGWMLDAYLEEAQHPNVSSLATAVYERMPNDTDLTVLGEAGMAGLNFAFVGGGGRYHTPNDDLAHLSWDTVQHQGQEALAAVRGLAGANLAQAPVGDDVFERVGGLVLSWPRRLGLPLCVAAFVAALGLGVWLRRSREVRIKATAIGMFATLAAILGVVAASWALGRIGSGVAPLPIRFSSHAVTLRLGLWLGTASVTLGVGFVAARWCRVGEMLWAATVTLAAFGIALSMVLPGASIIALVPAASMVLAGIVFGLDRGPRADLGALVLGLVGPVTVYADLGLGLEQTFGMAAPEIISAPAGLMAVALLPIAVMLAGHRGGGRLRAVLATALGASALTVWGASQLAYDPDNTYPVDLVLVRNGPDASTRWVVLSFLGPPPKPLVDAGFSPELSTPLPWEARGAYAGPPSQHVPGPGLRLEDVEVLPGEGSGPRRTIRGRLRSSRGSFRGRLYIDEAAGVTSVRLDQHLVQPSSARWNAPGDKGRWGAMFLRGFPPDGIAVELQVSSEAPVRIRTVDMAFGLPPGPEAQRFLDARPPWAGTLQMGDLDVILDAQTL